MSTGKVSPPVVEGLNAHLEPGQAIQGSGEIKTLEILGIKFSGGKSEQVGTIGNGLYIKSSPTLNPLRWLFGSPANVNAAVDSAYYDAVDKTNADGIISTRIKGEKTGWTFLHIFGWGTATAEVRGREVIIEKGQLPGSNSGGAQPNFAPGSTLWDWLGLRLGWLGF